MIRAHCTHLYEHELAIKVDMLTIVCIHRIARDARFRQSVDRNSFRSPREARDSGNVQLRPLGSTFVRTAIIRMAACRRTKALGQARRSPPARNANSNGDPLDHRLSVIGYRLSATITPRLCGAKPACADQTGLKNRFTAAAKRHQPPAPAPGRRSGHQDARDRPRCAAGWAG